MEQKYVSIFIYRIKPEAMSILREKHPEVLILSDAGLCEATYCFVDIEYYNKNKTLITGCLLGAYNEVNSKDLLDRKDIDKMFSKLVSEKKKIAVGDLGTLKGFGSVQMIVTSVDSEQEYIKVCPTNVNLFKPIECLAEEFILAKELDKFIAYTYNATIAIDCDIFPNIEEVNCKEFYFIIKETLAKILYNVHNMLDNIRIVLLNPCPLIKLAGATLGVKETYDNSLPLITDSAKGAVRLNPKNNYSVLNVKSFPRLYTVEEKIEVSELVDFYKALDVQTTLNKYEIYTLLNRRFFHYKSILNIQLRDNPLEEKIDAVSF